MKTKGLCLTLLVLVSACSGPTGSGGQGDAGDFELPVSPAPWVEVVEDFECRHPEVKPECADGWCKIPAGCFLMGSPESEPMRGMYTEDLTPTVLTRPFLMQQTELTQEQWLKLVDKNPSGSNQEFPTTPADTYRDCKEPSCPLGNVSWQEAVMFANLLSASEGRPECYVLKNCTGVFASGIDDPKGELSGTADGPFECESVELTTPTLYECEGYRLPTEAEHEYASRAGTRTAYYSGDLPAEMEAECEKPLEHLDAIAWYCANAGTETKPVGQKLPNQWGLYDTLGNADEWIHDKPQYAPGPAPWIDPHGMMESGLAPHIQDRIMEGGNFLLVPSALRVAARSYGNWNRRGPGVSIRLVRTLVE